MGVEREVIRVPGDKSISHRALMLAAMSSGRSRLRGLLRSADIESTARVLRALGAGIPPLSFGARGMEGRAGEGGGRGGEGVEGGEIEIEGLGLRGFVEPQCNLDCGNSGTTARLVSGIAAAHPFSTRFVGDESLSRRPMRRVAEPLVAMGARIELERDGLPMTIHGAKLREVRWQQRVASAQVKSAVLFAALSAGVRATVHEPRLSRDHTERMFRAVGVSVFEMESDIVIEPVQRIAPLDLTIPGDPSSAAFLLAAAVLLPAGELVLRDICLNETRTGFLRALSSMGGKAAIDARAEREEGGEPVGVIRACHSRLGALRVSAEDVPSMIDELPLLACVAARADGTSVVEGAGELRVKESNRLGTVVSNLRAIGVEAEELSDALRVTGTDRPLRGKVRTHGDHRIAMAFGVLSALEENRIEMDDPSCVAVSYPTFWEDLRRLTRR